MNSGGGGVAGVNNNNDHHHHHTPDATHNHHHHPHTILHHHHHPHHHHPHAANGPTTAVASSVVPAISATTAATSAVSVPVPSPFAATNNTMTASAATAGFRIDESSNTGLGDFARDATSSHFTLNQYGRRKPSPVIPALASTELFEFDAVGRSSGGGDPGINRVFSFPSDLHTPSPGFQGMDLPYTAATPPDADNPPVRRSVDSLQTRHQHQQMLLVQQQLNQQQQQQQLLQLQSSGASSSQKRPKKKHFLHKTELCRTWRMFGSCPYGNKCQFAHSESELRFVTRHPKWKTALCKRYWMTGTCPFGDLCSFIHRLDESSIFKQGNLPLPVESSSRVMNVDSPQQQQQQHSMDRRSQMSQAMAWQIERSSNPSLPSSPRRSVEDPFPAFADFDDSQWFPDDAFYSDPTPTSVAVTEPTLAAGTAKPSPAHLSAHFPTEARRPPLPHSLSAASADRFRPTRRRSLSPDFANLLSPLSLHSTDDSGARLFPGGYPRSPATQTKASLSSQPPPPPSFSTLSLSPRRGLPLPTPSPSASSVQSSSLLQPPPGTMLAPTSASTHSDSTWLPPSFSSPPSVTNATKPRPGPPLRTSLSFSAAESGNLSVGWEAQQDSW